MYMFYKVGLLTKISTDKCSGISQQQSNEWQIHNHNAHVYLSLPVVQSLVNQYSCLSFFLFPELKENPWKAKVASSIYTAV
jgi:hypothetical protein